MPNDLLLDIAELRLLSWSASEACFGIPGTEYRLTLDHDGEGDPPTAIGRRTHGRIIGAALKMAKPVAGGNYIEPLDGHPRIVQGTVIATDSANHRLLVDLVVPVWVVMAERQSPSGFATGDVVMFYLKRGTRFERA